MIKINNKYFQNYLKKEEIENYKSYVKVAHENLQNATGQGNEFLGWMNLPKNYDQEEFSCIKKAAKNIQENSQVLLIIGIGGSYLGAKAVIDLLSHTFYNKVANEKKLPEIYFVGHNISSEYIVDLEEIIGDRDFSINVISKSGTTTEPAIAFRHFKNMLFNKYGEYANSRIYATTDKEKGALHDQAKENNWESFIVPDDIGGRFSVLTAVGLLPIAIAGIDIEELMLGAQIASEKYSDNSLDNDSNMYAVLRNIMYTKGKTTEILVGYEPKLQYFNEWWKQLFGESEGKDGKGLYPSSVIYSTDLHSLGQYVQEGRRNIFETVINIKNVKKDLQIKKEDNDQDGLNYLASKNVSYVNQKAFEATSEAHMEGDVPSIVLEIDEISPKSVGELIYFFEKACAVSGYLLGVNPFDQPGVEAYKNKMFALLDKPGF